MARPTINTKLNAPRLRRGLVARPRLNALLRRGAESRLTLISAPAGFGKTTLLAGWFGQSSSENEPVAWVSLDASDNEPASFWTYVVTALHTAMPGLGEGVLKLISSTAAEQLLTTLLNELNAAPDEIWLVLDDYHLIENREIRDGITFLLEHLPPSVHVVLSTRADPDLPLSRWRVRGELVEIRAAELRFTSDEATAYLNEAAGLGLTADDVAALTGRTEGWIAALQLAALSIRGHDDASAFIARFTGDDRYIVDYLVEEVLADQPGGVREFLLQTAVLDRLSGSLCDAVTGRDDGHRMLLTLERANLFLVALDDQREWYRYHQLFADVLRARMVSEQPELVPQLHERASRWYEEHDLTDEAIRHALAGHDFGRTAYLVELAVPAVRRDRADVMLASWLKALPDNVIRSSPVLNVFYAFTLMVAGDIDSFETRLDDAERTLAAVPAGTAPPWADTVELHRLPATIAIYRASLAQARGDAAGTSRHARHALEVAEPDDHLARGGAFGFLGLAAWSNGNVPEALETFAHAVASLHAAGNLVDELSITVILADLWLVAGQPGTARRLYQRALKQAGASGETVARATAELHVGLSEIDCDAGDLGAVNQHLVAAAGFIERGLMTESRYRWFVAKARATDAGGDPDQAITLLDQAEKLYRRGFFPDVRPIAAIRARIWIAQGQLAEAAAWAAQRGVSVSDAASYLSEYDHLTLARLLIAQHRAEPCSEISHLDDLLGRMLDAAEASGRAGSAMEIRRLQALSKEVQGPPSSSSTRLLSDRELQVLRLLDSDLTGPQIARELFVTHNTLRTHTKHIFTKLDVTNRRAALARAREQGLI